MRIVVHAGMSKTGSTSIQKSLAAAANALAKLGVAYPALTKHPQHVFLLPVLLDPDEARTLLNAYNAERLARMVESSQRAWAVLDAAVAQARAEGAQMLVLSAEQILGMRTASAERLRERLAVYGCEVEIVAYLRAPAGHYLSSTQQALKFGHVIRSPTTELTYKSKVGKFMRLFDGKVRVRVFERDRLTGGDVVRDFLEVFLGLPPEVAAVIPTVRDNESVSAEGMALLQEFHRVALPGGQRRVGNPLSRALLALIQAEEAQGDFPRPVLHPHVRAVAEAANRRDVLWLRDEMGLSFAEFDYTGSPPPEPPPEPLDVADICPVDPARLARLRARVLLALLSERKALLAADPAD